MEPSLCTAANLFTTRVRRRTGGNAMRNLSCSLSGLGCPPGAWRGVLLLAGGLLCQATAAERAAAMNAVHVRGSTTLLPMAQRVAEAYMAHALGAIAVVSGGGTAAGVKALLDGTAEVAMTNGPIPEELRDEMARRGVRLLSKTVGFQSMLAVVHPANPIVDLSLEQLRDIFNGTVSNWREVGGQDAPIEVIVDTPDGSLHQAWKQRMLGNGGHFPVNVTIVRPADKLAALLARPHAVGYVNSAEPRAPLKALSVDGVVADPESLRSNAYPLRIELNLLSGAKPSPATQDFIAYFVAPGQGLRFIDVVQLVTVR